ncbi:MAG: histidine phosphatase family protein [Acidobacteria bacterium]|nr:histidine phosphatase family protein [Acidobacteriota bacterium]
MRAPAFVLALVWLAAPAVVAGGQEAIVVVRHAERADASADSPLSAAGETRAARLAAVLEDAGISRIYTTTLRRTLQTAAPLAAALMLTPVQLPQRDLDALFDRLGASTRGDRVLIVGHSNTLPEILRRLGVTTPVTIGDDQYDNLFVVTPRPGLSPLFVRLRY